MSKMASVSTAASFVIRCVFCFIFIIILVPPQIAARSVAGASNKGGFGDSKVSAGGSTSESGGSAGPVPPV